MSSATAEEVKESLSIFDIEVSDGALEKMLEIACLFSYDADTIVNEWLAFQSTHSCSLNVANLEKLVLEKTLNKNRGRNNQTPLGNRTRPIGPFTANNIDELVESSFHEDAEEDNLLSAYGTPGRPRTKRSVTTTPRSAVKVKPSYPNSTPTTTFSPSTLSPSTPSQKYSTRSNRGDVIASFGPSSESIATYRRESKNVSIVTDRKGNTSKSYKYMFQKLVDLADVMDDAIETLSDAIKHNHSDEITEEFVPCTMPSQEPVFVAGRICCDQGGGVTRLNAQSVLLQGSRFISNGKSIRIDFSSLEEYSIFPGQIVVMHGTNPTGRKFIPTKIFTSGLQSKESNKGNFTTDIMSLLVAAGPFTTSDCLSYEPLHDLIQVIRTREPDVTIIVGPVADNKHEDLQPEKLNVTYEEFLQDRLNFIIESLKGYTQLIFVPSSREAGCHPVYPQPPYRVPLQAKDVHLVRDPSIVEIQGLNVAVTSNDVLMDLCAEEISKIKGNSDRLCRLAGHVLQQRSFYPLCPSSESMNVDWIAAEQFSTITRHPDILILPSNLKSFFKQIDGCLCINPGRLAKGLTGGTFAQVLIETSPGDKKEPIMSAQIVKI